MSVWTFMQFKVVDMQACNILYPHRPPPASPGDSCVSDHILSLESEDLTLTAHLGVFGPVIE